MGWHVIADIRNNRTANSEYYRIFSTDDMSHFDMRRSDIIHCLELGQVINGLKLKEVFYTNNRGIFRDLGYEIEKEYEIDFINHAGDNLLLTKRECYIVVGVNDKGIIVVGSRGDIIKLTWVSYLAFASAMYHISNVRTSVIINGKAKFVPEPEHIDFKFDLEEEVEKFNNKLALLGAADKYRIAYDGYIIASEDIEEAVVPYFCERIYNSTFAHSKLENIKIGSGVKVIEDNAFNYCMELKEIEIPSNVRVIASECFSHCENLERVIFNEGLEEIAGGAFRACYSLTRVRLPKSIKKKCYINSIFDVRDGIDIVVEVPRELKDVLLYKEHPAISITYY